MTQPILDHKPDDEHFLTRRTGAARGYAGAILVTAIAVVMRCALWPWVGQKVPFAILYGAIAYTAWRGGVGPSIVSTLLGGIAAVYLFVPPEFGFGPLTTDVSWSLGVYLFTAFVMTLLGTGHRAAELKAREAHLRVNERENALERLLSRMSDAFIIFDSQWRYVYANEQAVRLSHRTHAELIGHNVWELFPENVNTNGYHELIRCQRDQVPVHYEVFVPRLQLWVEVRAYPASDGVSLFAADVSERKRAEQALQDSAAHNRAILEAALDGIITIDEQGTIESVNPAAERRFGYRASEIIGKNILMLMSGPYGKDHTNFFLDYLETGRGKVIGSEREVRGRCKDGTTFPMDLSVSDLRIGGRRIFIGLIHDITGHKLAEEQREHLLANERMARSDAEHASRMKDEFLATVSHELRTPLNAILGWAQLLRAPNQTENDIRTGLETMERNARLQAQLIEDLLDMSRITSGRLRLDVQPVDLREVIRAAIESVQLAADAKLIAIECDFGNTPLVSGDPARLQQVIWNLLSNAIKFTPREGGVRITLKSQADQLQLSVADTGLGIKPEFMSHLFERFRQADASTTRRYGGLGLGLAIARHLVELHGGTLAASSEGEGKGATFVVTLPAARATSQPNPRPESIVMGKGAIERDEEPLSLAGVRVLVVDDDPDARDVLTRLLVRYDAHVVGAGSAAEAMTRIQAELPQVLISDIGMPGEDGYMFLRRLRGLPPGQGGTIPALALTAFARAEDRTRAILSGYQAHLAKPVEAMELVANVAALAGKVSSATS